MTETAAPRGTGRLLTALVTPFDRHGALDLARLRDVLEWQRAAGVRELYLLGTSAEFTLLTDDERHAVTTTALRYFPPERVVVHCSAASTDGGERIARGARAAGARRFAFLPPIYLPADPDTVRRHLAALAAAVAPAEVLLYTNPARLGYALPEALVADVLADSGNVVGVKDTGGGRAELASLRRALPAAEILTGTTGVFAWSVGHGLDGVVSSLANAFPELVLALLAAARDGRPEADALQSAAERVQRLVAAHPLSVGVRVLMRARGLDVGESRRPYSDPPPAAVAAVRQALAEDAETAGWLPG